MIDSDALKLLQARRVIAAQQAERVRLETELRTARLENTQLKRAVVGLAPRNAIYPTLPGYETGAVQTLVEHRTGRPPPPRLSDASPAIRSDPDCLAVASIITDERSSAGAFARIGPLAHHGRYRAACVHRPALPWRPRVNFLLVAMVVLIWFMMNHHNFFMQPP